MLQLYERLRVGGVARLHAALLPKTYIRVVLGRQFFEPVERTLHQSLVVAVAAPGVQQRHGGVDDEQVYGRGRETLVVSATLLAEGVVGAPVFAHAGLQHCVQLLHTLARRYIGKRRTARAVELSQLRHAYVRKVLRAQTQESPRLTRHRLESELAREIAELALQTEEVGVALSRLARLRRHLRLVEQSRHAHEHRLHLKRVVAVVRNLHQWQPFSPLPERLAVDAEAEAASHRGEERRLPRAFEQLHAAAYSLRLLVEPLGKQRAQPRALLYRVERQHGVAARRIAVEGKQTTIVGEHVLRHLELHLRQVVATFRHDIGIHHRRHVQDHVVVRRVGVVTMQKPVGRALVNLHIAHPHHAVDAHLGVEEVGSGVHVMQSGVYHLHAASVGSLQFGERQNTMLPYIVQ